MCCSCGAWIRRLNFFTTSQLEDIAIEIECKKETTLLHLAKIRDLSINKLTIVVKTKLRYKNYYKLSHYIDDKNAWEWIGLIQHINSKMIVKLNYCKTNVSIIKEDSLSFLLVLLSTSHVTEPMIRYKYDIS